jgi:hypothetical protein
MVSSPPAVTLAFASSVLCAQGAGANILRAVAGAGVLSGYDQLQVIVFGKKFGGGE